MEQKLNCWVTETRPGVGSEFLVTEHFFPKTVKWNAANVENRFWIKVVLMDGVEKN